MCVCVCVCVHVHVCVFACVCALEGVRLWSSLHTYTICCSYSMISKFNILNIIILHSCIMMALK